MPLFGKYDVAVVGSGLSAWEFVRRESSGRTIALLGMGGIDIRGKLGTEFRYQGIPPRGLRKYGRASCWGGVVLPIDGRSLTYWDEDSRHILLGQQPGSYAYAIQNLQNDNCYQNSFSPSEEILLKEIKLKSFLPVPRAGSSSSTGLFCVYEPHRFFEHDKVMGSKKVTSVDGWVESIVKDGCSWTVTYMAGGKNRSRLRCDQLFLAAGPVQNVSLISPLLRPVPRTAYKITDHFVCGGLFSFESPFAVPPGSRITAYRSLKADFAANCFVELKVLRARVVLDVWFMIEAAGREYISPDIRCVKRDGAKHTIPNLKEIRRVCIEELRKIEAEVNISQTQRGIVFTKCDFPDAFECFTRMEKDPNCRHKKILWYERPYGSADHESVILPSNMGFSSIGLNSGFDNLGILGAMCFPRLGAANPTLTIIAQAQWHAEKLK